MKTIFFMCFIIGTAVLNGVISEDKEIKAASSLPGLSATSLPGPFKAQVKSKSAARPSVGDSVSKLPSKAPVKKVAPTLKTLKPTRAWNWCFNKNLMQINIFIILSKDKV